MKRLSLMLIMVTVVSVLLMPSCMQSENRAANDDLQSRYSQLQTKYNNLKSANEYLATQYEQLKSDYDAVRAVDRSLTHFQSEDELIKWAETHRHDIPYNVRVGAYPNEKLISAEYNIALKVQEEAAKDGYLVSACIEGRCAPADPLGNNSAPVWVYNTAVDQTTLALHIWCPWAKDIWGRQN